MTLPIKQNIAHLISVEAQICDNYGDEITLVNYDGFTGCTVCELDTMYNVSSDPACPTCSGKYWIPIESTYSVRAVFKWISEEEVEEKSAGGLQVGDLKLEHIAYNTKMYFDNAIANKIIHNIDGSCMVFIRIIPVITKTSISVLAKQSEPSKGDSPNG